MNHWLNTRDIGLVYIVTPEWLNQIETMCEICHKKPIYALTTCGEHEWEEYFEEGVVT